MLSLETNELRTLIEPGHDGHLMLSTTGTGHYVGNLLYAQEDHGLHVFLEGDARIIYEGRLSREAGDFVVGVSER